MGQECVKWELLSFQGKTETIASDLPGKVTVFLLLSGLPTHTKL